MTFFSLRKLSSKSMKNTTLFSMSVNQIRKSFLELYFTYIGESSTGNMKHTKTIKRVCYIQKRMKVLTSQ